MTADYTQYPYIEKRLRYFDGQFLKDQDFIDEQKYHVDRQRRHQRFLYVSGILDGLEVTPGTGSNPATPHLVTVAPGTALDREGRQLVLAGRVLVPLPTVSGEQQVYLIMRYSEIGSDPEQAGGDTFRRWHERPTLSVVGLTNPDNPDLSPIPPEAVVLALLTIATEGRVTVDPTVRDYSGLALPGGTAATARPTLRSGGTRAPDLAVLRGRLHVTGLTGLGTDTPQGRLHIVHEPQDANGNALIVGLADGSNLRLGYHTDYAWLQSHGNRPLTINPVGNAVGIGTTAPKSTLAIAGGMAIGSTYASNNLAPTNSLLIEGNVGVGTPNPIQTLDINGGIRVANGVIQGGGTAAITATSDFGLYGQVRGQWLRIVSTQAPIRFFTDGGIGTTSRLSIDAGGNVGIGTTTPQSTLAIAGGVAIGNTFASNAPAPNNSLVIEDKLGIGTADLQGNYRLVLQQTTANSGYGLRLLNPDQSRSAQLWVGTGGAVLDAEGSTHLHLRTAGADRLFISNDGNIGVGKTNPLQTLDINGRLHIANGVIQQGGNAITNTNDLGLYSQVRGQWVRIVANSAPIRFFTDGGIGSTIRLSIEANGNVSMSNNLTVSGAITAASVDIAGQLRVRNVPFGDRRNMQWEDSTGLLFYDNSSRRYKENITDLEDDFAQILRAQPKTYTRPDYPDIWEIGYIAEEFQDLGLDRLLYFDQEGLPDGINYRKISLYLLEVVKDLAQKVQGYEQRLEQLESKDLA